MHLLIILQISYGLDLENILHYTLGTTDENNNVIQYKKVSVQPNYTHNNNKRI